MDRWTFLKWIILPAWLLGLDDIRIPAGTEEDRHTRIEVYAKCCPDIVWPVSVVIWIIFLMIVKKWISGVPC